MNVPSVDIKSLINIIEKKEQKITILFQTFANKVNNECNSEQDKNEFFEPLRKTNKNIISDAESSKTKISANLYKSDDIIGFTNEKRDSPSNSFFNIKLNEIYKIQDLELEEDCSKIHKEEINQDKVEEKIKVKINIENINSESKEEEESDEIVESYEHYHYVDKNNLQPCYDDIISDFKEKTKNIKIELYKKSTLDLDEESMNRR